MTPTKALTRRHFTDGTLALSDAYISNGHWMAPKETFTNGGLICQTIDPAIDQDTNTDIAQSHLHTLLNLASSTRIQVLSAESVTDVYHAAVDRVQKGRPLTHTWTITRWLLEGQKKNTTCRVLTSPGVDTPRYLQQSYCDLLGIGPGATLLTSQDETFQTFYHAPTKAVLMGFEPKDNIKSPFSPVTQVAA
tara:strand:- start:339 stop:914 length:576 start_codon:yes stop_codon:yes gene_type:complete